jgi:hypothetical protein
MSGLNGLIGDTQLLLVGHIYTDGKLIVHRTLLVKQPELP